MESVEELPSADPEIEKILCQLDSATNMPIKDNLEPASQQLVKKHSVVIQDLKEAEKSLSLVQDSIANLNDEITQFEQEYQEAEAALQTQTDDLTDLLRQSSAESEEFDAARQAARIKYGLAEESLFDGLSDGLFGGLGALSRRATSFMRRDRSDLHDEDVPWAMDKSEMTSEQAMKAAFNITKQMRKSAAKVASHKQAILAKQQSTNDWQQLATEASTFQKLLQTEVEAQQKRRVERLELIRQCDKGRYHNEEAFELSSRINKLLQSE